MKESWIFVSDNTNINWVKTFHLYKGFFRKKTKISFFVKASCRVVEPPRLEYKGFKYKYAVRGNIVRLWLIRLNYSYNLKSNFKIKFRGNSGFCIKKKNEPKSKYLNGPISFSVYRKKLKTLFKLVL